MLIKGNWHRHGSELVICWCQRFFLAASRFAFAASPLNYVVPSEKKNLWVTHVQSGQLGLISIELILILMIIIIQ